MERTRFESVENCAAVHYICDGIQSLIIFNFLSPLESKALTAHNKNTPV